MLNLLHVSESHQLIAPTKVGAPSSGARILFTIKVTNVDDVCDQIPTHGGTLSDGSRYRFCAALRPVNLH